jgi:hypothetical protein
MARAVITNVADEKVQRIFTADYAKSRISYTPEFRSSVSETIPFRIKFINIGIEGYGPSNAAPIGIAIIGVNNYIL